ncbi:MAG: hypothetical protein EBW65_11655, partial [Gammaproteobacteria bacterium]|nr:hypothetical protein [Gammaproteobacteria bacterium]
NSSTSASTPSATLIDNTGGQASVTLTGAGTYGEGSFYNDRYDSVTVSAGATFVGYADYGPAGATETVNNSSGSSPLTVRFSSTGGGFGDNTLSAFTLSGGGSSSDTDALTIDVGNATFIVSGIIGGSAGLGAIDITGNLNLDADITSATSLNITGNSDLAADITTTGTQTYGDNAASDTVTLEAAINFTTTDSNITFNSIVDSNNTTPKAITIDMDNSGAGADGTVTFAGVVGTNEDVAAIGITGNLDLNAAIGSGATAGATSINVSGTTNLGANVTTSATQTYQGTLTLDSGTSLTLDAGTSEDSDINLAAVTGVSGGAAENLTLDAGNDAGAAIAVTGTVTNIATLTITDAGSVTFGDAVTLATKIDLVATTGTITF